MTFTKKQFKSNLFIWLAVYYAVNGKEMKNIIFVNAILTWNRLSFALGQKVLVVRHTVNSLMYWYIIVCGLKQLCRKVIYLVVCFAFFLLYYYTILGFTNGFLSIHVHLLVKQCQHKPRQMGFLMNSLLLCNRE